VHDEFRICVRSSGDPRRLLQALHDTQLDESDRLALGRLAMTHEGDHVFLYADSDSSAERAKTIVEGVLARGAIQGEVSLWRWHPLEERWEDAAQPLPSSEEAKAAEEARREEHEREESASADPAERARAQWEVRVTVPSHHDARELAERLREEGVPVTRRWRHLLVGAASEDQARELVERLRAEAPQGSEIVREGSGLLFWSELHPFAAFGGLGN